MHHTNISFRKENKQIHFCLGWHNFFFLIKVCLCKWRWIEELAFRFLPFLSILYVLDTLQMCAMYTQWKMKIDRKLEDSLREVLTHTITLLPPSRGESLLSIIYSIYSCIYSLFRVSPCQMYKVCWLLATLPCLNYGVRAGMESLEVGWLELQTKVHEDFIIMEKSHNRTLSWFKASTSAITFKIVIQH